MVHGHFGQMLRDELDIVGTGRGDGSAATEQRKHNWASLLYSTAGDVRGSWTHLRVLVRQWPATAKKIRSR